MIGSQDVACEQAPWWGITREKKDRREEKKSGDRVEASSNFGDL